MKLKTILEELDLLPRGSREERQEKWLTAINRQIRAYIKNGCKGNLYLSDSPVQMLPDDLKEVGGDLKLSWSNIKKLPNNLNVRGSLGLTGTSIETLPHGLFVGGNLMLDNSKIKKLPSDLVVVGDVYLLATPISKRYTTEEIKKMITGISGAIFGPYSNRERAHREGKFKTLLRKIIGEINVDRHGRSVDSEGGV